MFLWSRCNAGLNEGELLYIPYKKTKHEHKPTAAAAVFASTAWMEPPGAGVLLLTPFNCQVSVIYLINKQRGYLLELVEVWQ